MDIFGRSKIVQAETGIEDSIALYLTHYRWGEDSRPNTCLVDKSKKLICYIINRAGADFTILQGDFLSHQVVAKEIKKVGNKLDFVEQKHIIKLDNLLHNNKLGN